MRKRQRGKRVREGSIDKGRVRNIKHWLLSGTTRERKIDGEGKTEEKREKEDLME